jgi:hypothetical protein
MSSKRTPEEILASIETSDVDAEIERALAMSPEERRAELEGAGYDLKALDAKADAVHEAAARAAAGEARRKAEDQARKRASEPPRRRPVALWLLAAAIVVVAVGAWIATREAPAPPPTPTPTPSSTSAPPLSPELVARANEARSRAFAECAREDWFMCRTDLDQARDLDPAGDTAPQVVKARAQVAAAERALPPADAGKLK